MKPSLNIRRAGAGHWLRVRPAGLAFAAMLAIVLNLASPLAAQASLGDDIKDLPGDTSPKQACAVLIKDDAIKPAQEKRCRKLIAEGFAAAKSSSANATITIISTTVCALQIFEEKIEQSELAKCAKDTAAILSDPGGGFDPIGAVGDAISGAADFVGGLLSSPFVAGFKAIMDYLFAPIKAALTVALIKWIITIPNLSAGHVGNLEARIAVGAGGLLAATTTISIVRFWGAGLTGDGGWAGAEGIARAAAAAALIGLWPQIFDLAVRLSNALQTGILNEATEDQLTSLFRNVGKVGLISGGVPLFFDIAMAIVGTLMLLALVAMKIIITALTIVLFCAMPLALVIWPIPEMAGAAKYCLRTLAVLLAIPVMWCVIFGAFAAIGADTFTFHNTGKDQGLLGTTLNVAVVRPLVAISLLYLALVMPRRLLQLASFPGGGGGGVVRSAVTYSAVHAGFRHAPQIGQGAVSGWTGNPLKQPSTPVGRAARLATQRLRGALGGTDAAKGASKLRDRSAQASNGGSSKTAGQENGQRSQQGDTASSHNGQPSAGSTQAPYSAFTDQEHAERMKRDKFGGPFTDNPPPDTAAMKARHGKLAAEAKSGKGATSGQAYEAFGALRPDQIDGVRNVMSQGDDRTTSAVLAQWSETDNEHVSDPQRKAYEELARTDPKNLDFALTRFDAENRASQSGGGSGSGHTGTNGASTSSRAPAASTPSAPRTHPQPPQLS